MQTDRESARQGKGGKRVLTILAVSLVLALAILGIFEFIYAA